MRVLQGDYSEILIYDACRMSEMVKCFCFFFKLPPEKFKGLELGSLAANPKVKFIALGWVYACRVQ